METRYQNAKIQIVLCSKVVKHSHFCMSALEQTVPNLTRDQMQLSRNVLNSEEF